MLNPITRTRGDMPAPMAAHAAHARRARTGTQPVPAWQTALRPRLPQEPADLSALAITLGDLLAARRPCAVLLFHIDGLPDIIARHGDGIGRELVDQFGVQVRRAEPLARCLARLPGPVFALLISGPHVHADAETIALRFMRGLDTPFMFGVGGVRISASIGIALAPRHARDAAGLVQAAMAALDDARQAGGDTWRMSRNAPAAQVAPPPEHEDQAQHLAAAPPATYTIGHGPMRRGEGIEAELRSTVLQSGAALRRRRDHARRRIRHAATWLVLVIAAAGFLRSQAHGTQPPTHAEATTIAAQPN
jgi:GGDEF domain-containing protein